MKDKILILGCGEQAGVVIDNIEAQGKYEIAGLTTNNKKELESSLYGHKVIGLDEDIPQLVIKHNVSRYILGIGNMRVREKLIPYLDKHMEAVNVIHPNSEISKHAVIGRGILIESFTKIANGATVGNHCIINPFSAINHDQTIGDNVLIASGVNLAGHSIGKNTIIADGVTIGFKKYIGANCIIGEGAVVTKNIPDNSVAFGIPAKVIRTIEW